MILYNVLKSKEVPMDWVPVQISTWSPAHPGVGLPVVSCV